MEVLEKVRKIIKTKFRSELIYSKKYLKVEKEAFNIYMHQYIG